MKVLLVNQCMVISGPQKLIKDICEYYDRDKIDLYLATDEKGIWDKDVDSKVVKHFYFEKIKERYNTFDKIMKHFFHKPLYKTLEEEFDVCIIYKESLYDHIQYVKAKKYILWAHEDYYYNKLKYMKGAWWKLPILLSLKRQYLKKYDAIVACTENTRESYEKYHKIKNVKVITNSINELEISTLSNEEINLPNDFKNNYIVNVNSLSERKRVDLLVDLFYECLQKDSSLKLVIIGDGDCRQIVEERIAYYNIAESCLLFGETSNPFPYIKHATMMVSAAYHESYGLSVAEAMYFGVPCVCLYNRGVAGFIENGINSITANSNEEFIKEVLKINSNEEYRQMLAENAKISMGKLSDIKGYVKRVEDFIFNI